MDLYVRRLSNLRRLVDADSAGGDMLAIVRGLVPSVAAQSVRRVYRLRSRSGRNCHSIKSAAQ